MRAKHAAHRERIAKSDGRTRPIALPQIVIPNSVPADGQIRFNLPRLTDPAQELALEVSLRLLPSSISPHVAVNCPGLVLKVWRPPSNWMTRPQRRQFVLRVPAALFIMRHITQLGIRAGSKTEIRELSVRWRAAPSVRERAHRLLAKWRRRMLPIRR
jgi:hypothetical protein